MLRGGELDRAACRKAAVGRFSLEPMVDAHVALFERVLAGELDGFEDIGEETAA